MFDIDGSMKPIRDQFIRSLQFAILIGLIIGFFIWGVGFVGKAIACNAEMGYGGAVWTPTTGTVCTYDYYR